MVGPEQHLAPLTFRPTRRQNTLPVGIFLVAISIFVIVFGSRQGKDAAGLTVGGVLLLLLGIAMVASRRAYTTIDRDGVRTRSMFGQRSCRWSEVTDIDVHYDSGDGPSIGRVRIQRSSGRALTLAVPTETSRKLDLSEPFWAELATIRSYWESAKGTGK
jgi:hypothetical protein